MSVQCSLAWPEDTSSKALTFTLQMSKLACLPGGRPYLESPSHKAGSQRTSCKKSKVIHLISTFIFTKES